MGKPWRSINSNHGPRSVLSPVLDQNKMLISPQFHIMFIKVGEGLWCLITLLQLICRDVPCLRCLNAVGNHIVCDCFTNKTIFFLLSRQDEEYGTLSSPLTSLKQSLEFGLISVDGRIWDEELSLSMWKGLSDMGNALFRIQLIMPCRLFKFLNLKCSKPHAEIQMK